jgi:hypothetical protein
MEEVDPVDASIIVLEGLPEALRQSLLAALRQGDALAYVHTGEPSTRVSPSYGDLPTGTVLLTLAQTVLPILASWLVAKAPKKPRKETFEFLKPDGTKVTRTVEYSSATSVADLVRKLLDAIRHD